MSLSRIAGPAISCPAANAAKLEDRKLLLYTLDLRPARHEGRGRDTSGDGFGGCIGGNRPITARRALTSTTPPRAARR